jgi:uroporphyrinogen decarboxylase
MIKKDMNSRERMMTAMTGGRPDRVPFNPQIIFTHAVRQLEKSRDYADCVIKCYEDPDYLVDLLFEMRKIYHTDGFRIMPMQSDTTKIRKEGRAYIVYDESTGDRTGHLDLTTGNVVSDDIMPVKSMEDAKKLKATTVEEFLGSTQFRYVRRGVKLAGDDLFKIGTVVMPVDHLTIQRGVCQAMLDLMDDEELVEQLSEVCLETALNKARAYIKMGIDGILVGEAAGSSSLISPDLFRRFSLPYIKRFCDEIRPSGVLLYLHICGNVRPIIEMMAGSGVHCIEPMDALGGMRPDEFRIKAGNDIGLMGGVNTVTLARGTAVDVGREARQCIEGAGKYGGYIMAAGDMVPFEAPLENVLEMYETASRHIYPGTDTV